MTPKQLKKLDRELSKFLDEMTTGMGRPERRSAMGHYVTGLLLDGERKSVQPMAARLARAEARELMALLRDPGSPRVPDWVLDDVIRLARTGPLARFAATRDTMEPFTLDGRLGELRVPVEIVWGASDRLMPLEYAERMRAELPDARVIPIERCGHAPQVECPEKLLAALLQAVDSSQPTADSSDPQPETE